MFKLFSVVTLLAVLILPTTLFCVGQGKFNYAACVFM